MSRGSKVPHGPPPLLGGAGKHLGHDGVSSRARENLRKIKAEEDMPPSMRSKPTPTPTPKELMPPNKRKRQMDALEAEAESPDNPKKLGDDGAKCALGHDGCLGHDAVPPNYGTPGRGGPGTPKRTMPKPMAPTKRGAPLGMDSPDKMKMTMDEFKGGSLHSGSKSGPKVTNRKQAIAIGLSQARKAGQK